MADATKRCTKCGEVKSPADFHRDRSTGDGLMRQCIACKKTYAEGRKAESSAYNRAHYLSHRESVLERTKAYQESNPERARKYSRKYNERNREKRRAYTERYRTADPDRMASQAATFRARHPDKHRRDQHQRRAMLAMVAHDPAVTVEAVRQRDGDVCCYCPTLMTFDCPDQYNPRRATLEHITPISKGGNHTFDNVALACRACNISKRNALPIWEWVGRTAK